MKSQTAKDFLAAAKKLKEKRIKQGSWNGLNINN